MADEEPKEEEPKEEEANPLDEPGEAVTANP